MKNFLLALVLLIAFSGPAHAAIAAATTWEVRPTNGDNTNGGGFVYGIGATDVAASATLVVDASNNKLVTSSAHTFVSGDVGKFIRITAGTGWTLGWYQVKSISGTGAVLGRSPAPTGTTSGTFSLYSAIDYTQQNAKNTTGSNISTTDAVAAGTTTLTSATGAFTAALPGNVIYLAGGTGTLTGGWYQVVSVTNSTTIVLDRSVAAGTGITMNIGGAIQSLPTVISTAVNNNQIFVKGEATITTSTAITFTQSGLVVRGYGTARGDTGRATIQATAGSINVVAFNSGTFMNFVIDCNSQSATTGLYVTGQGFAVNNIITNYSTNGVHFYGPNATNFAAYGNEISGGASGATAGIRFEQSAGVVFGVAYGNYIHDSDGYGILGQTSGSTIYINNVIANLTGATGMGLRTGSAVNVVKDNTIYNTSSYGIYFAAGTAGVIQNNLLSTIGADGIYYATTPVSNPVSDGNAFFSITGKMYGDVNPTTSSYVNNPYANTKDVVLAYDPFVNAAAGDFSLNSTGGGGSAAKQVGAPAGYVGLSSVAYPDFGAIQAQATGGGGGGSGEASFVFGN